MISGVLEDNDSFREFNCERKDVEDFRDNLKENYSKVTHIDKLVYRIPNCNERTHDIRNMQTYDAWSDINGRKRYRVIYDLYEYPYLVILIDQFLNGDVESLFEVLHPDFIKEYIPAFEKAKEEMNNLQESFGDLNELIKKISALKETLDDIRSGNVFVPIASQYTDFLSLINMKTTNVNKLINKTI